MEDTLTISLTPKLKAMLKDLTEAEGIPPQALVEAAIQDYLFIHKFRSLRSKILQKVEADYTDENIFSIVS